MRCVQANDIQRAFGYLDADGNGFLSPPELKQLLTSRACGRKEGREWGDTESQQLEEGSASGAG